MAITLTDESGNRHIILSQGDVKRKIVFTGLPSNNEPLFMISEGKCGLIRSLDAFYNNGVYTLVIPDDFLINSRTLTIYINTHDGASLARFHLPVYKRCLFGGD